MFPRQYDIKNVLKSKYFQKNNKRIQMHYAKLETEEGITYRWLSEDEICDYFQELRQEYQQKQRIEAERIRLQQQEKQKKKKKDEEPNQEKKIYSFIDQYIKIYKDFAIKKAQNHPDVQKYTKKQWMPKVSQNTQQYKIYSDDDDPYAVLKSPHYLALIQRINPPPQGQNQAQIGMLDQLNHSTSTQDTEAK